MKIVFIDADGTLCHLKYGIPPSAIFAIDKLKKADFQIVLCTSRSLPFVTEDILKLRFDGFITSCGANISDNQGVQQSTLPFLKVRKILDIANRYGMPVILCNNDNIFYDPDIMNSDYDEWFDLISMQVKSSFLPIDRYEISIPVNKICVKTGSEFSQEKILFLINEIENLGGMFVVEGKNSCGEIIEFEVIPTGCNKGSGVKQYLERQKKGNTCIETWAIGDDDADIEMFENVDYSIAMGQAADWVKAKASFVTGSFMTGGFADACNKIILKRDVYRKLLEITDISTDGILGYERFLIFEKAKWFDLFIQGKLIPPIQIDWQLSSACNLKCRWCVGRTVNSENGMSTLHDVMNADIVRNVAKKIAALSIEGVGIETVQFSGFTGEPLVHWDLLKVAILTLKESGVRIGIFTNGTLMNSNTWETLVKTESVHISIDGGRKSWKLIKQPNSGYASYQNIINNIRGLVQLRNQTNSVTEINTGYTVTSENIGELEDTIRDLICVGADSICIKYDITGNENLDSKDNFKQIINSCRNKYNTEKFKVLVMHNEIPLKGTNRWSCTDGCFYRYFFCTIGSDGNIYPCDYQTLSECPKFGNICDSSFEDIYQQKNDNWNDLVSSDKVFKNVCPPLAEVINPYLKKISRFIDIYGADLVADAIRDIRINYR